MNLPNHADLMTEAANDRRLAELLDIRADPAPLTVHEEELFARFAIGIFVGFICGMLWGIGGTLLIQGLWS